MEDRIPKIVKKALPAVVTITASKLFSFFKADFENISSLSDLKKPLFSPKGKKRIEIGGGSGFIVDPSGIILTNRHVIQDPNAQYIVILNTNEKFKAEVLARDLIHDIAILKIKGKKRFPYLKLGDSSKLQLGERVIAIGNTLGAFKNTVTSGIISGLSREITAGDIFNEQTTRLRGLIQTDAAINPGNSGGPLLNMKGEVIGINAATVFFAENVGFALPINNAKKDLEDLKKYGRLRQPFLGVRYILVTEDLQKKFNLPVKEGALIVSESGPSGEGVIKGSSADKAGLKEGDIILEVKGEKVTLQNPIENILEKCEVGEEIWIKFLRGKKEIKRKVVIGERK